MKKRCFVWLLALLLLGGVTLAEEGVPSVDDAPAYAAYNGKHLGVLTGPLMEDVAREYFPDSEALLFNSYPDCITALLTRKIDAYLGDELGVKSVLMERSDIDYVRERITENNYSFAFRKNDPQSAALCDELNTFLARCWADGTMDELDDIWFGEDEARKVVDMSGLTGENGTIKVVTTSTDPPFSYINDRKNVGYDIDLVVRFCRDRGYALELGDVDFAGRIPAIESGKFDFTTDMNVTPEREEQVLFSDPVCKGGIVLAVRKDDAPMATESAAAYTSLSQLNGARVGVQTGTVYDEIVLDALPDAQISYFNSYPDMAGAIEANKIDAFPGDEPVLRLMAAEDDQLAVMDDYMESFEFGFVIARTPEGDALIEEANAWLSQMRESGELDALLAKWIDSPESEKIMPDYAAFPAERGTLRFATEGAYAPMNYFRGNELVGFEVELAARFCEANGYGFSPEAMNFDGILPAVQAGKVDFGGACISITEERRESVNFSDPYYICRTAMCVLKAKETPIVQASGNASLSDLSGARIGVATGTTFDAIVRKALPDAKIAYINTSADLITSLEAGKIDGFAVDEPAARQFCAANPRLAVLDEYLDTFEFGFVLPKTGDGERLLEELDAWLVSMKESGALEQVIEKWANGPEDEKTLPDYAAFPAPKGKLTLATEGDYVPMTYYRGNEIVGAEIDLTAQFCEASGYGLEVMVMNFDGILPAVQAGKADLAAAGISITDERRESVNFSVPYYAGGTVMVVRKGEQVPAAATGVQPELTRFSDLAGKTVSMITGVPFEEMVRSKAPDVGAFTTYNNMPDMILALQSGKTDAVLSNNAVAALSLSRNPDLALLPQDLQNSAFGFAFAKGDPRRDEWQAAFDAIPEAQIQAAWDKWTGGDESLKVLPEQDWPGANGTVRVAACDTLEPLSYVGGDGELKGFDLEVLLMTARELDMRVEFTGMELPAILSSVQSGKSDIGIGSIIVTEERAQAVDFLEYYPAAFVLVVHAAKVPMVDTVDDETFWGGIKSSFNKTFIREGRWRLFVDGVLTTLLITVLTILFGTLLGFAVFMLCRNGNPVANLVTRFCLWLVQGMPMVVLLMILYYVIFGSVAISGVLVAVIGFTLTFGAAVFGLLRMGVGAVDVGQYEAAYALGHSNRRTFFRIILPQALPHVLPAYRGEIVGLIKATAIVGYIAVQDLTKMGDIVRSRTYEAFFPLIAVTVIYFVLEGLIGFLVSRISVSFNPKRRKPADILKGVKTDDQN